MGNCGFMGIPLLEALLPGYPQAVAFAAMFFMAYNILMWTMVSFMITRDRHYISIKKIFPYFILGFLAMSIVASIFPIPTALVSATKKISKFLMVSALAAIGLNTSFSSMKKSGIRPMIHGFIISALVVIVALLVEMAIGIV